MSEQTKDMIFNEIKNCKNRGNVDLCEEHSSEIESLNDLGV